MSRSRETMLANIGLVQARVTSIQFTLEASEELDQDQLREHLSRIPYARGARLTGHACMRWPSGGRSSLRWIYHYLVENP